MGVQNQMQAQIFQSVSQRNKNVVFDICDPTDYSQYQEFKLRTTAMSQIQNMMRASSVQIEK